MAKKLKKIRRRYDGPAKWLMPIRESAYTKLLPRAQAEKELAAAKAARKKKTADARAFHSVFQRGRGEDVLGQLPQDYWLKQAQEFKRRKANSPRRGRHGKIPIGSPVIPGMNNWIPLGPSVEARGQATGRPPVSGRIPGIAVAPGGSRVYVATAAGGVWRSDDGGVSWRSTMDSFDQNVTNFASVCLACGAIAIDPANPDRVYVGTGEGDTDAIFSSRLVKALPCYRGVGPLRSDDGGGSWNLEQSNPSLAGGSFYQIAVDPANSDHCVAATSFGLYERIPAGGGSYQWQQRRTGKHSSVVVASSGGTTYWFAAAWGDKVYTSTDGTTWTAIGSGFPSNITRIALGMQPDNPNVLYAAVCGAGSTFDGPVTAGALNSVVRLDGMSGNWNSISGIPILCEGGQGDYDLSIAVDPNNVKLIYLGGDWFDDGNLWPASVWRCQISSGPPYSMATTHIGDQAHADDHVLVFTPGDSNALWLGCDGGLFLNTNPSGSGQFQAMNTGLATLCTTHFGQHSTEPAVMFCGLQDNGSAKFVGEEVWTHVWSGDGGYCVVNWNDPFKVLVFAPTSDGGQVYRATDGGIDYSSWTDITPSNGFGDTFETPLVGAPYNPGAPSDADLVVFAAATINNGAVWPAMFVSTDFGSSWPVRVIFPEDTQDAYSMTAASAKRFYLGTSGGEVYRFDNNGGNWALTQIDNVAAGPLGVMGLISDIAIDESDASLSSIYVCLGGSGDYRHVWHFDGTSWSAASGTAGSNTTLLDIEHNAIQYDKVTGNLYVAADLGVWESTDKGATWNPMANGLPDAAVFDLQIHPTQRVMRASLHGRGLWEWKMDLPIQPDVELMIRDTLLDMGNDVNDDGRPDPSVPPGSKVAHWASPNIKVDVPTPAGYQTPTTSIDFFTFDEAIVDGSQHVGTIAPPATVHNRLYAEIHNRGAVDADSVQVMALLTNASSGLPLLPANYASNVTSGTPINTADWTTLGFVTLTKLHAGVPQIAYFDIPSTVLPMPASLPGQSHYCVLVLLHSAQDAFSSTQQNVDLLTLADRKVAQKNLHIVEFMGVPPPPSAGMGMWAMLHLNGYGGLIDLAINATKFPGKISLLLPPPIYPKDVKEQAPQFRVGAASIVAKWIKQFTPEAQRLYYEAKFPPEQYRRLTEAMKKVAAQKPLVAPGGKESVIRGLPLNKGAQIVFLRIDPPAKARVGDEWIFDVYQRNSRTGKAIGGSRYKVVVNRKT